jgi:hypothetical protein
MRARWHKWWPLALLVLVSACLLNPQPDIPGSARPGGSAGGSLNLGGGKSGSAGGLGPSSGGGLSVTPDYAGQGPDINAGEGGDRGGSAGDSGMAEGGAAEGGAAGTDLVVK